MQALISLGNGDMRRTLNIFQVLFDGSTHLLKQHSTRGVMLLASCDGRNYPLCKYASMWHGGVAQATSMSADTITEDAVYQCTGNPLPKDIEQVAHWLLNESFTDAFESECRSCPWCCQLMCGDHG
jgi:DNA polymerase III delta prime subunit